jgi:hypothetical protein
MESQASLKSIAAAVVTFAVTVAMHEAARGNRLAPHGVTPLAMKLAEWGDLLRALTMQ